jgi:hypothetical protein
MDKVNGLIDKGLGAGARGVAALVATFLVTMGIGFADPQIAPTPTQALHPWLTSSPFPGEIARFSGLVVQLLVTSCHTKDSFGKPITCAGEVFRHTTVWIGESPTSYTIAFLFAPAPRNIMCEAPMFSVKKHGVSPLPSPDASGRYPFSQHVVTTDGRAVQILDAACAKIATEDKLRCEGDWLMASTAVLLDGERYYSLYFYPSDLKETIDKPLQDPAEEPLNCG